MQELRLGEMIRRRREELNINQEVLCEGLCDRSALSRFENGHQALSRKRVVALLQRLGLPDDRFYALLSEDELAPEEAEREARDASVSLGRASGEERGRGVGAVPGEAGGTGGPGAGQPLHPAVLAVPPGDAGDRGGPLSL